MTDIKAQAGDTLVSIYKLYVYASGRVETVQQDLFESLFTPLDIEMEVFHPSSRVSQALDVIEHVTSKILEKDNMLNLDTVNISFLVSKACSEIATRNQLSPQTVIDKISRQMKLTLIQFHEVLLDYYSLTLINEDEKSSLRTILLDHASKNHKNDDSEFIIYSLNKLSEKIVKTLIKGDLEVTSSPVFLTEK